MEPLENINIIRPDCQSPNLFQNTNIEIKSQIINGLYPMEDIEELSSLEKIALLYYLILLNKYDEFKNIVESYDINLNDGDNILIKYCCHKSMYDYIKLLLKNGVNINICNDIIIKLVMWPTNCINNNNKQVEFIKYLIDNGANIYCDNNYPLKISTTYGTYKMVDLLLNYGADIKVNNDYCLCSAVKNSNYLIEKFIDKGADINCRKGYPLRKAVFDGNYNATKILLEYGADISYLTIEYLKTIIKYNNYELIKLLIDYGVDFSILNNEKNMDIKTVDLLYDIGIDHYIIFNILLNFDTDNEQDKYE
nr:hypothetical protein [Megavirus caiporensis]